MNRVDVAVQHMAVRTWVQAPNAVVCLAQVRNHQVGEVRKDPHRTRYYLDDYVKVLVPGGVKSRIGRREPC